MKGSAAKVLLLNFVLVATTRIPVLAEAKRGVPPAETRKGLPTDWSHHHLIFSQPRTVQQAERVQHDPRYLQQQRRRSFVSRPQDIPLKRGTVPSRFHRRHHRRRGRRMHRDWSVDMGPGAHMSANMFPAKFSFDGTTANCGLAPPAPDYVTFATGLQGTPTQAGLVGYTNLYVGCSGPVPGTYFAYNTGGAVLTSPVPSLDGTQLAFTHSIAGVASLVILKWLAFDGFVQTPDTLTPTPPASYFGCAAPCMTTLPLGADDTNSAVFYDYGLDTAWVGDNSGKLHKFTGVFNGTPAEVVAGWPALLGSTVLTSPVHDGAADTVFIGDAGGFLYRVDSSGAFTKSGQLGQTLGIDDTPMVDQTAGVVYVFVPDDGGGSAGVFQLTASFASGNTGTEVQVGLSGSAGPTPMYDGDFDFNYVNSATASGNMYVCGNPGGRPTLYQVPISAGVMGTPKPGPVVSTTFGASCSPVTDVYNPTISGAGTPTEWVFLSTQAAGSPSGCTGFSCVMNFRITSWQPSTVYNLGQEVLDSNLNIQVADNSGGTSGLTPPAWNTTVFGPTVDGTVHWRNQGPLTGPGPPSWIANNAYPGGFEIVDSNNNIEITQLGGGTSGGTTPTWGLTEGATTFDGTLTWVNLGMNPVAALSVSGGTSGIIIDNTLNLPGASQVYFSTLQDQGCFTSGGTGGCAVQASQQGLQ